MNRDEIESNLEVAVTIVETAGAIALRYFRTPLEVTDKSQGSAFDPVTRADREVESAIRDALGRAFPDHGILGEEHGTRDPGQPVRWLVDPIDGTRAFISGVPTWGILLGLMEEDACLAGIMHQPYLDETFLGGPDGARMRRAGKEIALRTRQEAGLSSAILYCTHPSMFPAEADRRAFESVAASSRMMRYGGDCYSYCLLAMGQIDLVVEAHLQPYDIVPLIPIVEAAGGIVTDWSGSPANRGGRVVAAANPALHRQALEILNS